jgi:S1-C subfamily serine protease
MKKININKISRTFMPEIIAPGTGLSPVTDKSTIPFNNVHTIQDVLDGKKYVMPGAGGSWGDGEDIESSYKDNGDSYKRKERDLDILNKLNTPVNKNQELWKVKVPGGSKTFPSFALVQNFREKMKQKGIPIEWVKKIAQNKSQMIADSLSKTFKIESIDAYESIKETGSSFCVAPNIFITCAHVVLKYNKNELIDFSSIDFADRFNINIMQNGLKYKANVININGALDIAILHSELNIDNFDLDLDSMEIGDEIVTIGSPHGFENNASFGNIGSIGKQIYSHKGSAKYFFIDAPVFHGNSGGPIIKINNGKVIGMLTSIVAKNGEYGLNVGLPSVYIRNFLLENNIS